MASSVIPKNSGLRYVDYTIPSRSYSAGVHTLYEGDKGRVFGIPYNAKIVSVANLQDSYMVRTYGIDDYQEVLYLRIFIQNVATVERTEEIPIRIFYVI